MNNIENNWLHDVIIILLIAFLIVFYFIFIDEKPKNDEKNIKKTIEIVEKVEQNVEKPIKNEENQPKMIKNVEKVELIYRLTSYRPGDEMGSGTITGSDLTIYDFQVNDRGWYIYNGKIVLAGATNECLNSTKDKRCMEFPHVEGKHYFNYFDELEIMVDGVVYDGIILDSCGGCMYITYENRIDLFVSTYISPEEQDLINEGYTIVNTETNHNKRELKLFNPDKNMIDRGYQGVNPTKVFLEVK